MHEIVTSTLQKKLQLFLPYLSMTKYVDSYEYLDCFGYIIFVYICYIWCGECNNSGLGFPPYYSESQ